MSKPITKTWRVEGWGATAVFIIIFLLGFAVGHCQTSHIPASSAFMRVTWADGGHAPGDIISYYVQAGRDGNLNGFNSTPTAMNIYRVQVPDSGVIKVKAISILTDKESVWSVPLTYAWLKDGAEPPVTPPDTIIPTPTDGMPVVYNAAELQRLWTIHDGSAAPTGDGETYAIYSGNSQIAPAFISARIYHPTSGTYFVRIDGRENGALVMMDGAEILSVAWNENNSTASKVEVYAERGWHEYRIYGHGTSFATCRAREFRIYRSADYTTPGNPNNVKAN